MAMGYIEPIIVPSAENVADMFTNPLEHVKYLGLRRELGLR